MSYSRASTRARLSPAWNYVVAGVIWRVSPDGSGHLIGEERDPERRAVVFFCLNASDGTVLWEHLRMDDEWWVGNEVVGDVNVLIHPRGLVFHRIEREKGNGNSPPHSRSVLNVVDASGRTLVFSDLLDGGNTVPAPFFTDHDVLLYLKRRNMLSAVHLVL